MQSEKAMPVYDHLQAEIANRQHAKQLLMEMGRVYDLGKSIRTKLNLYMAGTDPDFNAVMDSVFTPAERTELNQMLTPLATMIEDWKMNHFDFLFPDPE
jgi:hypothetical protein